jgi:anti-sigma B factor antagonist
VPLEIAHREQEGIEILTLKGRLIFGEEDLALRNYVSRAAAAGKIHIVMDLGEVADLDDTGLGTLLFVDAALKKAGGGLALANLRLTHLELLVIARLETQFQIFEQDQDAINSFFPDRQVRHYDLLELIESMRQKQPESSNS